jgi:ribosomal protein S18 acetylase RimI-like enzyme
MKIEQRENIQIIIEKGKEEDIFEIQEVLYKTWIETYPNEKLGITRDDIEQRYKLMQTPENKEARIKRFRERPQNAHTFVAKVNGKIVGCCTFIQHKNYDQLKMFYVLPSFQKKGVAKAMWEEIQKMFVTGKRIIVQVADYNEKAIKYYEKLGFKDNGKRLSDPVFKMPISGKIISEMEMEMIE